MEEVKYHERFGSYLWEFSTRFINRSQTRFNFKGRFEFQLSESDSDVIESRKIKVKEKTGQGQSGKGQIDQTVNTPNKNRTGSDNRKQAEAEVNGNLSDDENIAGDDLDKMLVAMANRTEPDRKRKRRTRTVGNNSIVVGGGPRNMDNNNNNNNSADEIKARNRRQPSNVERSKSDSETTSAGISGKRDAVVKNKEPERQRKTPAKDRNNAKADSTKLKTPVKNTESFKSTPTPGKTPIKESSNAKSGTPVKNLHNASKTTDAGRKTPMKNKNNSSNVTKETNSRTGDNDDNDNDKEDFRSCASSPQQLIAAQQQQQVPQPQNRYSPGTSPLQPRPRTVGAGKPGKKKLFSRSPDLFDVETRLPADKRHSRESVSVFGLFTHTETDMGSDPYLRGFPLDWSGTIVVLRRKFHLAHKPGQIPV